MLAWRKERLAADPERAARKRPREDDAAPAEPADAGEAMRRREADRGLAEDEDLMLGSSEIAEVATAGLRKPRYAPRRGSFVGVAARRRIKPRTDWDWTPPGACAVRDWLGDDAAACAGRRAPSARDAAVARRERDLALREAGNSSDWAAPPEDTVAPVRWAGYASVLALASVGVPRGNRPAAWIFFVETSRGDAAAATWIFRGGRGRRGSKPDRPRRSDARGRERR